MLPALAFSFRDICKNSVIGSWLRLDGLVAYREGGCQPLGAFMPNIHDKNQLKQRISLLVVLRKIINLAVYYSKQESQACD